MENVLRISCHLLWLILFYDLIFPSLCFVVYIHIRASSAYNWCLSYLSGLAVQDKSMGMNMYRLGVEALEKNLVFIDSDAL